ncbi:MAG TPA: hypothetical protein V6D00_10200 [Pantanalinema sp.]
MNTQSPELEQLFRTISMATLIMAVVWLGVFLMDPPSALAPASLAPTRPDAPLISTYDTSERAQAFRGLVQDLN